jgi:UDP-3-O-[3-hydroxymyristoyl] glucosamine N-acyltransferase LpxD
MPTCDAQQIADFLAAPLKGKNFLIEGPATLDSATSGRVVFLSKPSAAVIEKLNAISDLLVIAPPELLEHGTVRFGYITHSNPRFAFAQVLGKFFAKPKATGIAPTAQVDPSARLGKDVVIGHYSVIGAGVVIGDGSEIRNHVVIAAGVRIGADCLIKSGTVIGEEGFGFEKNEKGIQTRIPHVGSVTIGDRVEVGALTSICCGTVDNTIIGDDTKIDDHVFIAHNVKTGKNCVIIAAAEVSGSVTLGDNAWLAPACTIINGVSVGADALIGIGAVITKPVEPRAVMGGARAQLLRYLEVENAA